MRGNVDIGLLIIDFREQSTKEISARITFQIYNKTKLLFNQTKIDNPIFEMIILRLHIKSYQLIIFLNSALNYFCNFYPWIIYLISFFSWGAFNGILLQNCSDLLWEKILLVIQKNIWNSRLKAENLKKICDH